MRGLFSCPKEAKMSYNYDTSHSSPHYTAGREGNTPDGIVIHHWGSSGQTHDGVVAYLCISRPANPTSAHYVVSAGRVSCIVDPDNTAYHAGNWSANLTKIGIECRPEMTSEDMTTVAELIADIRNTYGNLPLSGHCDWQSTACPGNWYGQLHHLDVMARQVETVSPAPAPEPAAPATNYDVVAAVIAGEYGNGEDRVARLRAAGFNPDQVQAEVNARLGYGAPAAPATGPDIDALANAVIAGEYGNGDARVNALGDLYGPVQARVNELLGY